MKRPIPWWVFASLFPFGWGAWAPTIPGIQLRRWSWIALGVVWTAAEVAGWISPLHGLIVVGWVGAAATAVAIRPACLRTVSDPFRIGEQAARKRLQRRHEAQRLARERPEPAKELGVGHPDRSGAQAAGLVDVNTVLDLDGDVVERLREDTVFLPR